jgi:hypothetical protein
MSESRRTDQCNKKVTKLQLSITFHSSDSNGPPKANKQALKTTDNTAPRRGLERLGLAVFGTHPIVEERAALVQKRNPPALL